MNRRTAVLAGLLVLLLVPVGFIVSPESFHRGSAHSVSPAKNPGAILPLGSAPTLVGKPAVTPRTLDVDGTKRSMVVVVPQGLEPSPWLILALHGDGGSADSFHGATRYERASGTRAVLAYPDGGWDLETLEGNRDEAFLAKLIDTLVAEFHVDPRHVFATGYSSGGFFINVFACHRPGVLRAIASSAAGAPYNQKQKWPNGYPGCPGQKATPMMALHGTEDYGVTLDSGRFSAQYWAYVNGCDLVKQETTSYPQCVSYAGCPAKAPVVYCEVPGLSHWVWDKSAEASFAFFTELVKDDR